MSDCEDWDLPDEEEAPNPDNFDLPNNIGCSSSCEEAEVDVVIAEAPSHQLPQHLASNFIVAAELGKAD
uniref:OTU family cysteine protease n=1 Tax=Syphacia muris TaxID=451379 RepID=A0A0N5ACJ9_9BILA